MEKYGGRDGWMMEEWRKERMKDGRMEEGKDGRWKNGGNYL